jgi:ABC-2 type transporter
MTGFLAHLAISCRLHLRNRMALVYGYLFPLIFLVVFWVLYRHETVPLLRHLGELLTVTILGGACFGLPTTLVSDRERGVWRRYRLTPVSTWTLVGSTIVVRFLIIVSAGLLQFGVALAIGMTAPAHPIALAVAFTVTALAFIGLGLLIAMMADNVPAVQALGQCVFLPMLVIGGVAVPIASLPGWAQQLTGFFPGRYAVESMQAATTGSNLENVPFSLMALALTGFAGAVAGAKLFRWDAQQRFAARSGKGWLGTVFTAWIAVGLLAAVHDRTTKPDFSDSSASSGDMAGLGRASWEKISSRDVASLDYRLPPDDGVVAPFADADAQPDDSVTEQLGQVRAGLPDWTPGSRGDDLQRVRYLLCVAAVPDCVQDPVESFVPAVVLEHLKATFPRPKLIRMLTWIAMHPDEGAVLGNLAALGLPNTTAGSSQVRERSYYYAIKFVARLTGRR